MFAFLLAAGDPGQTVGQNLGDMLHGAAVPIFIGVVGVFAIGYLTSRNLSKLAVFVAVAVAVGVIVLTPDTFGNIVQSVGDALGKGV